MRSTSHVHSDHDLERTVIDELLRLPEGNAWAAGLFEGEGCVTISRIRRGSGRAHYLLTVAFQMGDRDALEALYETWGGRIYSVPVTGNRRPMWSWRLSARMAAAFLREIAPYLATVRQRRRVAVAIEFQEQKTNIGRSRSPDYLALQEAYYDRMRFLNRTGTAAA